LILALAYLMVISLTVAAVTSWAANDLGNTTHFNTTSQLHYAVSSATNTAIESIRYVPMPSATPAQKTQLALQACWPPTSGSVSQLTIDGYGVTVWCSTYEDNTQSTTRVVTLYACLTTSPASTSAQCQAKPYLTAVATFDDYPSGGLSTLLVQCNQQNGQCGYGQTINSWDWA